MPSVSSPPRALPDYHLRLDAARHALSPLRGDELRDVASDALLRGTRSRSLAMLAGAPGADDPSGLRALFEAGLREVGIALPRPLDAAERLKRHYAGMVAAGRLSALEGARAIVDVYWRVGDALPAAKAQAGDEFGIATLYGLYAALDGLPAGDRACAALEAKLVEACGAIAAGRRV